MVLCRACEIFFFLQNLFLSMMHSLLEWICIGIDLETSLCFFEAAVSVSITILFKFQTILLELVD